MLKITSNLPIPRAGKKLVYPWDKMKVGDSVKVRFDVKETMRVSASNYGRRHNMSFATRKIDDKHTRIWRIK